MKNYLFLVVLAVALFSACQKEVLEPNPPNNNTPPPIDTTSPVDTTPPPVDVANSTLITSNDVHNQTTTGISSTPVSTVPLVPMEVGNKWIYRRRVSSSPAGSVTTDTIEYFITDSIIIHNKKYYRMSLKEPTFTRSEPYTTRQNGDYISRNISSGVETIFLKDNLAVGDTWMAPPELKVLDINRSVTVPAGAYTGVVRINQFELNTSWPTRTTTITSDYKEGVGMVKQVNRYQYGHLVNTTTLELISYTVI